MGFSKIFVIFLIMIFLSGCQKQPAKSKPAEIVFTSNISGNFEVYTIDSLGKNRRRLTFISDAGAMLPKFSPDGRKIAYLAKKGSNVDLIIMNSDGSAKRNLMPGPAREEGFSFSSDSKEIAIVSDKDGDFEIYTVSADGGKPKQLTHNTVFDGGPVYSNDDRYIYWGSANDKAGTEVNRMDKDGKNNIRYTFNRLEDGVDSVSDDGKLLAASSIRDNSWEILIFNADGKKVTRFTYNSYYNARAIFTPKGNKLIWTANPGGKMDVMLGDATRAGKAINLTKGKGENNWPNWSTDGRKIVFESNRTGKWHIYTINEDGSGLKQITRGNSDNRTPHWR